MTRGGRGQAIRPGPGALRVGRVRGACSREMRRLEDVHIRAAITTNLAKRFSDLHGSLHKDACHGANASPATDDKVNFLLIRPTVNN